MSAPKICDLSPHGWTLDTLEEHLSGKIDENRKYFSDLSNERELRTTEKFVTSKEAVTSALAAAEKAITAAMNASEKAIIKAEVASEKRSEASNEIRAAMMDQQKNFADKSQTEFRLGVIEQRINENMNMFGKQLDGLNNTIAAMSGRTQGAGTSIGVIVQVIASAASIAAILGVVAVLLRH